MVLQTIFVNWSNGAFIMTAIFGLVIASLIGFVIYYISKSAKKEREEKQEEEENA